MENLIVPNRVRVFKNIPLIIKRDFPKGDFKLNIKAGDEINLQTILGEGSAAAGFRTVHLAKDLGEDPKTALKFLRFALGQKVFEGELLALKEGVLGFSKKMLLVPDDGILDFYDEKSGDLRIKLIPKASRLISGTYGIIESVNISTGEIFIKTIGTVIYGIVGSGRERSGLLKVVGGAGGLVSSRQLNKSMRGQIIVGGGLVFMEALEQAINLGVAGIISGGINGRDYLSMAGGKWKFSSDHWVDVGLSLLVTEGFGSVTIGEDIFQVLMENNNKFAILDGNNHQVILPTSDQNSMIYIRKAQFKPLEKGNLEFKQLQKGDRVRVISPHFLGLQGVVEAIDQTSTKLPSGVESVMVTILTHQKKIRMPYVNLEVVG